MKIEKVVNEKFKPTNRLRKSIEKRLEHYSNPNVNFFFLTALSAAIASVGLVLNNTAIIIGAMVVAPLITPVFGLSLNKLPRSKLTRYSPRAVLAVLNKLVDKDLLLDSLHN